jgi:hypothetical protein
MRCDPRELLLCQPETIPIHVSFLPEALNHKTPCAPISLWVRTLIEAVALFEQDQADRSDDLAC